MKKLLLLSLSALLIVGTYAQTTIRANQITADDKFFPPVKDTTQTPGRVGQLTIRVQDTSLYMAISITAAKKWQKIVKLTDLTGGAVNLTADQSVLKTGDSLQLRNEKAEPAAEKTFYGFYNGSFGYKPGAIINNNVLIEHNDLYRYDSTTQEIFSFHTREMMGKLQFKARASGWIDSGDSSLVDSNFVSRRVWLVTVDGEALSELPSAKYYEHSALTGQLILHPSPADSSDVVVYTSWPAMWSELDRWTAPEPPSWSDIDFENVDDFSEGSPNVWWAPGGGAQCGDNWGVSNTTITGGTGAVRAQYLTANGVSTCILGIDNTNTKNCYSNYDAWIQVSSGVLYCGNNSGSTAFSGGTVSDGDYFRINIVSNVMTAEISSDGINWSVLYTYTGSAVATMYIKGNGFSTDKLTNPQKLD